MNYTVAEAVRNWLAYGSKGRDEGTLETAPLWRGDGFDPNRLGLAPGNSFGTTDRTALR